MSLQFIFGNSGSGKSHTLYQTIIRESREHPDQKILVLVPEQFTMQTQKDLVLMHPMKHTLAALPKILKYYRAHGLRAITVSENLG